MRHAGPQALTALADPLAAIRLRSGLREPRPGVFYRKSKAWLHFHEDSAGLFADLRVAGDWQRFRVEEPPERMALFVAVERGLGD